jgi:hypothetical protein
MPINFTIHHPSMLSSNHLLQLSPHSLITLAPGYFPFQTLLSSFLLSSTSTLRLQFLNHLTSDDLFFGPTSITHYHFHDLIWHHDYLCQLLCLQLQAPQATNTTFSFSSLSTLFGIFIPKSWYYLSFQTIHLLFVSLSINPLLAQLNIKVYDSNFSLASTVAPFLITWKIYKLIKPSYPPAPHLYQTAEETL